jgi:hypothetical protein
MPDPMLTLSRKQQLLEKIKNNTISEVHLDESDLYTKAELEELIVALELKISQEKSRISILSIEDVIELDEKLCFRLLIALSHPNSSIRSLYLNSAPIGIQQIQAIINILIYKPHLHSLSLQSMLDPSKPNAGYHPLTYSASLEVTLDNLFHIISTHKEIIFFDFSDNPILEQYLTKKAQNPLLYNGFIALLLFGPLRTLRLLNQFNALTILMLINIFHYSPRILGLTMDFTSDQLNSITVLYALSGLFTSTHVLQNLTTDLNFTTVEELDIFLSMLENNKSVIRLEVHTLKPPQCPRARANFIKRFADILCKQTILKQLCIIYTPQDPEYAFTLDEAIQILNSARNLQDIDIFINTDNISENDMRVKLEKLKQIYIQNINLREVNIEFTGGHPQLEQDFQNALGIMLVAREAYEHAAVISRSVYIAEQTTTLLIRNILTTGFAIASAATTLATLVTTSITGASTAVSFASRTNQTSLDIKNDFCRQFMQKYWQRYNELISSNSSDDEHSNLHSAEFKNEIAQYFSEIIKVAFRQFNYNCENPTTNAKILEVLSNYGDADFFKISPTAKTADTGIKAAFIHGFKAVFGHLFQITLVVRNKKPRI